MDLSGKVMIVTGASSGIGAATARAASRAGARLVLAARNRERLDALAAQLTDAVVVPTDMRNPDEIRLLVEAAVDRCAQVDILVNNAGEGLHVPVEQIALDDFVSIVELNLYGTLLAMQAVIPVMRSAGGGCIINVSSGTTRLVAPVGYSATTEFHDKLRAGSISTSGRKFEPDSADRVADAILDLIRTGAEEAVLVPEQLRRDEP